MWIVPAAFHIRNPRKIRVGRIAHRTLVVGIHQVSPHHHTVIGQLLLFSVGSKMFQYHISIVFHSPNLIGHAFQNGNARSIVAASITGFIGEAFGEVEAKPIHLKLLDPETVHLIHKVLCISAFVVKVVAPAIGRMRTAGVVPGIVGRH